MSGTVYANMSCRLIVAQMSGTRCELINNLIWPLAAAVIAAVAIPGITIQVCTSVEDCSYYFEPSPH